VQAFAAPLRELRATKPPPQYLGQKATLTRTATMARRAGQTTLHGLQVGRSWWSAAGAGQADKALAILSRASSDQPVPRGN
jgi:hypothetical protein